MCGTYILYTCTYSFSLYPCIHVYTRECTHTRAHTDTYICVILSVYIYIYVLGFTVYRIKRESMNENAVPIATTRTNFVIYLVRASRFLNLLDCTTDDGDENDRVSGRPYHCSAAINTQQWTGTNKLEAFPDVDARSLATAIPPPFRTI